MAGGAVCGKGGLFTIHDLLFTNNWKLMMSSQGEFSIKENCDVKK